MSPALQPFVESEDVENGDVQTPHTAAAGRRPSGTVAVAAGGVLLLTLALCACLWMGEPAGHLGHPYTHHGHDFDAINFEGITEDKLVEFLNLGPGSVCRGDKVDSHLGPTGKEGTVLSDKNPEKDGVSPEKCRALCAGSKECKGYELGPVEEKLIS
ncbi:unnamed protein product [Symbiodinium natans]|uniref:Uncharacterized protein n=1 Tax=Symbiodinium natans TaxID=878477 RepID=A0A812UXT6_9DINO|nr:unnamed protein product [Symbiodinium natans]